MKLLIARIKAKISLVLFRYRARKFASSWEIINQKMKDAGISRAKRKRIIRDIIKGRLPKLLD